MEQISIDFSGKRTCKRTVALAPECDSALLSLAKFSDKEPASLLAEYAAECVARDFGKLLILQSRGKVTFDMPKV